MSQAHSPIFDNKATDILL